MRTRRRLVCWPPDATETQSQRRVDIGGVATSPIINFFKKEHINLPPCSLSILADFAGDYLQRLRLHRLSHRVAYYGHIGHTAAAAITSTPGTAV